MNNLYLRAGQGGREGVANGNLPVRQRERVL